jgi:hypothetical protein
MRCKFFIIFFTLLVFSSLSFGDTSDVIKGLRFVVLPESGYQGDDYTKYAINVINEKISEMNIEYVEPDVLEKIKKKLEKVYEEKKGEAMSLSQILSSSVGGSVYIEVSTKVDIKEMKSSQNSFSGVPAVGVYQGYVRLNLSAFDASTGRGLGKVIMTTNKAFGGDTSKYVESLISDLAVKGLEEVLKKIENYVKGGNVISLKVIGIKNVSSEKEFSQILDGIPGVKLKTRKAMSGDYVEYSVIFKGTIDEFIDDLTDSLSTSLSLGKPSVDLSGNQVIVKLK